MSTSLTLASLTTEIATHLGKELDNPFKRVLAQKVDNWRSRLIRNSLQDKLGEAHFFVQTVYLPLELMSPVPECLHIPVCDVLVTTRDIPQTVRYGSNSQFEFVGAPDGFEAFTEAAPGTQEALMQGKHSKKKIFYTLVNKRFELRSKATLALPWMRVGAIFDKPLEAMELNCAQGIDCDYWDQPYPVTGDIAQMIVQGILETDFQHKTAPQHDMEVQTTEANAQG